MMLSHFLRPFELPFIVSAEQVEKPVAVRFGWANVPEVNLYNKAGLPASPFRTDVEK